MTLGPRAQAHHDLWRPIETAPREGDFLAHLGNGYITRARFINGRFFASDSSGSGMKPNNTDPTHWQPLPDPPVES